MPSQYNLLPPLIKFCNDHNLLSTTPEKLTVSGFCTDIMELFLPINSLRLVQARDVIRTAIESSPISAVDFKVVSLFLPVISSACSSFYSVWKVKNSMTIVIRQTKRFAFVSRLNKSCKRNDNNKHI